MNINQITDRSAGIKLAEAAGAPKTAALIADKDACFQDIFESAVSEIGPGPLVEALQKGPRLWSHMALSMLPNLGSHGEALNAALASSLAVSNHAQPGDRISKFSLYMGAAVSGIVRINNTNDYRNLFVKNTYEFNPADQNIPEGTVVRMYFGIEDDVFIGLAPAQETFIFDSSSPKIAYYTSAGIAGSQTFAFQP
ncbi:MAG: hypothetical protein H7246_23285 [Phycisphaerae bacterium]|nr:hypothetical protein [Saprospiraceae bacterium]